MSLAPGAHRIREYFSKRSLPSRTPIEPLAYDCSHHHVRRPDRCRNAVTAVHIANLGSRRHREARSCCRWRQGSLILHSLSGPIILMFPFACTKDRTVTQRGCNSRSMFSKLSNSPTFQNLEMDKQRPRGACLFPNFGT